MSDMYKVLLTLILTMIVSLFLTEVVRFFSIKVGAVDEPNSRRINTTTMPSSGGLAIYVAYFFSLLFLLPIDREISIPIFIGASIIVFTGLLDDIKDISPKLKMGGIIVATLVIYFFGDLQMTRIGIPFVGLIELGYWSLPMTILWVAAITNAINLIDGLDGLATGISAISLTTIGVIAYFFLSSNNVEVTIMIFALVAAAIGFLPANYFPARIYLGDTGALFLGFMIAVFSLFNLKNITFIALVIPLVVLAIPIGDTLYAIIRRKLSNQPISAADNKHIHHRLMALGFSHKESVKLLYGLSIIFSIVALLFPVASTTGLLLLIIGLLLSLQFLAEITGIVGPGKRPLIEFFKKVQDFLNKDFK